MPTGKYDDLGAVLAPPDPSTPVAPKASTPDYSDLGAVPVQQPKTSAPDYSDLGAVPMDTAIKNMAGDSTFDPAAHAYQHPEDFETAFQVQQARDNRTPEEKAAALGNAAISGKTYSGIWPGVKHFVSGIARVPLHAAEQMKAAHPMLTDALPFGFAIPDRDAETLQAENTIAAQQGEVGTKGMMDSIGQFLEGQPGSARYNFFNPSQSPKLNLPKGDAAKVEALRQKEAAAGNTSPNSIGDARALFAQRVKQYENETKLANGQPLDTGAIAGIYHAAGQQPSEEVGPEALKAAGASPVDPDVIADLHGIGSPENLLLSAAPGIPGAGKVGGAIAEGAGKIAQLPAKLLDQIPKFSKAQKLATGAGAATLGYEAYQHPEAAAKMGLALIGAKLLGKAGEFAEMQGREMRTGSPSQLTQNVATEAATHPDLPANSTTADFLKDQASRAFTKDKAAMAFGNAAATGASTAVGMAPINAAMSDGDPQKFAESEANAAGFGGALGAFARNRPMMVEAVRPYLQSEGHRALWEAASQNDPLAAKSAAYVYSLPPEARDRVLEIIGSIQGLPTDTPNGQVRAKLYVLNDSDYRDVLAQKFGMQQAAMGGGRGFYIGDDGAAYVNGDYHSGLDPSELGHTVGHEFGGHAAVNIMQAMGAKGGQLYTGLIGAARDALMPGGRPTADFYRFVKNYNRAFDPSGQTQRLDFQNTESIEEFLAEQAGQLMAAKGAGELALPKTIQDKISDGLGRYLGKVVGVDTDKVGTPTHFGREEVGKLSKLVQDTLGQVVGMKLRGGAEIPEPAKTTQTRIDELNHTLSKPRPTPGTPLEETRAWIAEQAAARRELSQLQGSQSASFPAAGTPPTPPSAPQAPNVPATPPVPSRASVAAALRINGIPAAEAAQWAQRAQGATLQDMILDALKQRAAQKFPNQPPPAQTPPNQPPVIPPAEKTPVQPSAPTVENLTHAWQQSAKDKGIGHPDTKALYDQLSSAMTAQAQASVPTPNEPTQPAPTPNENGALPPGRVETEERAGQGVAPAQPVEVQTPEHLDAIAAKAREEFLADKELAKSGKNKGQHTAANQKAADKAAFDAAAEAHAETVPENYQGLRQRTDAFGQKSVSGKVDPSRPFDAWLIKQAMDSGHLTPDSLKTLLNFQDSIGKTVSYDYGHAPVADEGDMPTKEGRAAAQAESSVADRLAGGPMQTERKTSVPLRVGYNSGTKSFTVYGASQEKLLNNFNHLAEKMQDLGITRPFRDINDPKFVAAFKAVIRNQEHGWTGDGKSPSVGTEEFPNTPDPTWKDSPERTVVPDNQFQFVNAILADEGAKPPRRGDATVSKAKAHLANENQRLLNAEGETNPLRQQINDAEPGWTKATLEDPLNENISPALASNLGEASQSDESIRQHGKVGDISRFFDKGQTPNRAKTSAGFLPDTGAKSAKERAQERINARFMPDSTPSKEEPAPEGQGPSGSQPDRPSVGGTSKDDSAAIAGSEDSSPSVQERAAQLWKEKGTDSPFFKKWFSGSKTVNPDGSPIILKHGSRSKFNEFDQSKNQEPVFSNGKKPLFFSESESTAKSYGQEVGNYFVKLNNPLKLREIVGRDEDGEYQREAFMREEDYNALPDSQKEALKAAKDGDSDTDDMVKSMLAQGSAAASYSRAFRKWGTAQHDGIIAYDTLDRLGEGDRDNIYIAFDPEQIKAAENAGTFDAKNSDMHFMPDTGKPEDGETPGERLMREAESAGLAPSLDLTKGILRNDAKAKAKLRIMIRDRTGRDARFMPALR